MRLRVKQAGCSGRALAVTVVASLVLVGAAASQALGKPKPVSKVAGARFELSCTMSIATQPPAGSATVEQPPQGGSQYGPLRCPRKGFGRGIIADSFAVAGSGDMIGRFTEYFAAGSVNGRFDLAPAEGQVSSTTFTSQTWAGTLVAESGTGVYRGLRPLKRPGSLTCTSTDSVHLSCAERTELHLVTGA